MMKLFKQGKIFKKKGERVSLDSYWKFAVFFMFLVAGGSLFFGHYLFTKISEESAVDSTNQAGVVQTVKKERIDKALEYFLIHKQKSDDIMGSPTPVIDPSL